MLAARELPVSASLRGCEISRLRLQTRIRARPVLASGENGRTATPAATKPKRRALLKASGRAEYKPGTAFDLRRFAEYMRSDQGHATALGLGTFQDVKLMENGLYRCTSGAINMLAFEVTPVVDLGVSVYRAEPVSAATAAAAAASGLLFRSLGANPDTPGLDLVDICSDPATADTALCDEVWARAAAGGMDDGVAGDYGGAVAAEAEAAGDNTCLIRMLGCRLEGSAAVREQNEKFRTNCMNRVSWADGTLTSLIQFEVQLEVFSRGPLSLLPVAAVERPGSKVLQNIVDRSLPGFLKGLHDAFQEWEAKQQAGGGSSQGVGGQAGAGGAVAAQR